MSEIPEDIQETVLAIIKKLWPIHHDYEVFDAFAAAILAERERCAQSLESLVEKRRKQNPKAHLGNDYILSCARFIRDNPHSLPKAPPSAAKPHGEPSPAPCGTPNPAGEP